MGSAVVRRTPRTRPNRHPRWLAVLEALARAHGIPLPAPVADLTDAELLALARRVDCAILAEVRAQVDPDDYRVRW